MRHHAEHVATLAEDPRDIALGAVGIGVRGDAAPGVRISEDNPSLRLELLEDFYWRHVSPVAVRDWNPQNFALLVQVGEHGVRILDADSHFSRYELQVRVAHQSAGQQSCLAGDLKPVADREHGSAVLCMGDYFLHDRAEARDRTYAQVVAVTEAARQNDHI